MMAHANIKDVLKLIHVGEFTRAVDCWRAQAAQHGRCGACFYTGLPKPVRCARCLDGHVSVAELHRTYNHIDIDELTRARHSLKQWLER